MLEARIDFSKQGTEAIPVCIGQDDLAGELLDELGIGGLVRFGELFEFVVGLGYGAGNVSK